MMAYLFHVTAININDSLGVIAPFTVQENSWQIASFNFVKENSYCNKLGTLQKLRDKNQRVLSLVNEVTIHVSTDVFVHQLTLFSKTALLRLQYEEVYHMT